MDHVYIGCKNLKKEGKTELFIEGKTYLIANLHKLDEIFPACRWYHWLSDSCLSGYHQHASAQAQDGLPDCQRRRNSLNEACCPKFEEQKITSPKNCVFITLDYRCSQGNTACFVNFPERVDNLTSISSLVLLSIKYIILYIFIF